jgi:hypothetical protein
MNGTKLLWRNLGGHSQLLPVADYRLQLFDHAANWRHRLFYIAREARPCASLLAKLRGLQCNSAMRLRIVPFYSTSQIKAGYHQPLGMRHHAFRRH